MEVKIGPYLSFAVASEQWLETMRFVSKNSKQRVRYIADRTYHDYEYYVATLKEFFANIPLNEVSVGNIRTYQSERSASAGANKINSETQILKRILHWAKCWTKELEESFQLLQSQEPDVARAMTPEEQETFLATAASRSQWELVHWFSVAALKTTLTNCEMTGLKLGDIQLTHPEIIQVRTGHAKNKHRVRTIGLASEAVWAFTKIVERAHSLGATGREDYVFPFREKRNNYDPTRPMTNSGIKKPFDEIRHQAGVPWLRIHDLRHSGITRLAEEGTPMPVIMSMAGHITQRMMQHYTHICQQSQRKAQEKASGKNNGDTHAVIQPLIQPAVRTRSARQKAGPASVRIVVPAKWKELVLVSGEE